MRTRIGAIALLVASMTGLTATPAGAATPACAVTWGSLEKSAGLLQMGAPIVDVRAGRHDCYDRLVVDIAGPAPGYRLHYVSRITQLASGEVVPVRGEALLEVIVRSGVIDPDDAHLTFPRAGRPDLVNVSGYSTFRQVAWAGSQEGVTEIGLGLRARLPFRLFLLSSPGSGWRLVIDVAHHW